MDSYISFIHSYWFRDELDFDRWFKTSHQYDSEIKILFSDILKQAEKGNLESWSSTQQGFVSYVVLLDQFSRQIYRNSHKAYSNDARVINFVRKYLSRYIKTLSAIELLFVLMPFQHSEDLKDQEEGLQILKRLVKNAKNQDEKQILSHALSYQKGHYEVIKKFGRFPKRNSFVPNRNSTKAELKYISQNPEGAY